MTNVPLFVPIAVLHAAQAEIARLREVAARREQELAWLRREVSRLRWEAARDRREAEQG